MKQKTLCCLGLIILVATIYSVGVFAKQNYPGNYGDNVFSWYSDVPSRAEKNDVVNSKMFLIGTGGIRVNAAATKFGMYQVAIDGSGMTANASKTLKVDADFNAAPGTVYFVRSSVTCTLPSASGLDGQEILVWNDCGSGGTVTYKAAVNQSISVKPSLVNNVAHSLDRFMSDGNDWLKE